jgi:hypothetical protein
MGAVIERTNTMTTTCTHEITRQIGEDRCYVGPVYTRHVTDENQAAHGGIEYTQECAACGAQRVVLVNGRHDEVSAWGEPRVARLRRATAELRRLTAPLDLDTYHGRSIRVRIEPAIAPFLGYDDRVVVYLDDEPRTYRVDDLMVVDREDLIMVEVWSQIRAHARRVAAAAQSLAEVL